MRNNRKGYSGRLRATEKNIPRRDANVTRGSQSEGKNSEYHWQCALAVHRYQREHTPKTRITTTKHHFQCRKESERICGQLQESTTAHTTL